MKKFLFIALTAALLASCQNNPSDSDNNQNTPPSESNRNLTKQTSICRTRNYNRFGKRKTFCNGQWFLHN
ncbi:membrane lipoprotein lipid attachment site-containing protein [uncultured Treponema sp.]|uniref:membrane lipoprotein lipid attachment site-containing protein n=1 Tax=uncultured Treponema sp. TaxID=162155 RepID=UPI00338E12E7